MFDGPCRAARARPTDPGTSQHRDLGLGFSSPLACCVACPVLVSGQEPAAESCKMPPVLALLLPAGSQVANAWGLSQRCLNRWSLWCEPWREEASTKCCSKSHNGMSYTPVGDSQALHLRWWWLILRVSLLLQRLWQTAHLPPPRSILP